MDRRVFVENPFRPGAGHTPPYFGGRKDELERFQRLMRQDYATENILVTGLRGFGKTVLLSQLRTVARENGWLWSGNDLSESASLSEERLAIRILADLASALPAQAVTESSVNLLPNEEGDSEDLGTAIFDELRGIYERTPGLTIDRLRAAFMKAISLVKRSKMSGIVLAYDEAQCLFDHADRDEFPMSTLVELVSSLQKQDSVVPVVLVLCGLPQVFDALTATRTYTERMFNVMRLNRLNRDDTLAALAHPLVKLHPPLYPSKDLVLKAAELTGGYPYLIQFFGRELVEQLLQNGGVMSSEQFPSPSVIERLDAGLFSARWNRTTDKQRDLLQIAARGSNHWGEDFSAAELSELSNGEFSSAQANQYLVALCEKGIIYRTRHGRYAFTVPMSESMIINRMSKTDEVAESWETAPKDLAAATAPPVDESVHVEVAPKKRGWFGF